MIKNLLHPLKTQTQGRNSLPLRTQHSTHRYAVSRATAATHTGTPLPTPTCSAVNCLFSEAAALIQAMMMTTRIMPR